MAKQDGGVTKQLQKQFRITTKKDKRQNAITIYPGVVNPKNQQDVIPIKFSTDIQKIFQNWKNDLTNPQELRDRFNRYSDIDFMVINSGYIGLAVKLYSNETIAPDESGKIIKVYSRNKEVEKYINEFFQRVGVNRAVLENTAYDIAKYGDHFWIRVIDAKEGITEIVPIDVVQVKERIEFSATDEITKKYSKLKDWGNSAPTIINMNQVRDAITSKVTENDYGAMFRRFLFGFSLGEGFDTQVLPPWAISHFRRFSTQSEFAPFGRPLLINSLSIYREYKSALNLLAMARVAKFPKEVFKIQIDENMTSTERVIAVNEARQEFLNLVNADNALEPSGIGSAIWTIKELFEYDLIQNNMDLDDIADVELLKDELIASTLVPKGYMIADTGWGDSGKSLIQQSKVFSREVFTNQTAILTELTDLVKTQFVIMGLFEGEDTEFELSLPYPNSAQVTEDLENHKDMMDLAQSVIENLKTALAIDSIPVEVAKDILKRYAMIDHRDLDKWVKDIEKHIDLEIKQSEFEEPKYTESFKKNIRKLNEEIFREAYFQSKKDLGLTEGVIGNTHYFTNFNSTPMDKFKFSVLKEMLKEEEKGKLNG